MSLQRASLLVAFAAIFCSAQAWNDAGHMTIAEIAYEHMTPEARAAADKILQTGGTDRASDFLTSACWPDDIRRDRPETGPWHYIDLYFRTDGKPEANQPDAENAVWAISKFKKVLMDKSESPANRAEALRFLLHFVGDIHQPLHAVSHDSDALPKGDEGGNKFPIESPASMGEHGPKNLHALWDRGCGLFPSVPRTFRPLDAAGKAEIQEIAKKIETQTPFSDQIIGVSAPMQWAEEGQALCKEFVYSLPEGSQPTDEYLKRGQEISEKRAAEAGYRLSALLNEALK